MPFHATTLQNLNSYPQKKCIIMLQASKGKRSRYTTHFHGFQWCKTSSISDIPHKQVTHLSLLNCRNSNIVTTYINFRNSDTVTSTIIYQLYKFRYSNLISDIQHNKENFRYANKQSFYNFRSWQGYETASKWTNPAYEIMTSGNDTKAIHVTMFISSSPRGHALALYITNQQSGFWSGASREARY